MQSDEEISFHQEVTSAGKKNKEDKMIRKENKKTEEEILTTKEPSVEENLNMILSAKYHHDVLFPPDQHPEMGEVLYSITKEPETYFQTEKHLRDVLSDIETAPNIQPMKIFPQKKPQTQHELKEIELNEEKSHASMFEPVASKIPKTATLFRPRFTPKVKKGSGKTKIESDKFDSFLDCLPKDRKPMWNRIKTSNAKWYKRIKNDIVAKCVQYHQRVNKSVVSDIKKHRFNALAINMVSIRFEELRSRFEDYEDDIKPKLQHDIQFDFKEWRKQHKKQLTSLERETKHITNVMLSCYVSFIEKETNQKIPEKKWFVNCF